MQVSVDSLGTSVLYWTVLGRAPTNSEMLLPALQTRMPTMQRTATIRRQLRGEHLGQRYMSLDIATLGREAIRGLLNPGGKPASELNPLAIFAGALHASCCALSRRISILPKQSNLKDLQSGIDLR